MISAGGFKRKSKAASQIPSSSLADIAFLLLIFFMVTTTFRKEQDRDVQFPDAEATQKLDAPRKDVVHIYVERDGQVFINDANIPMPDVSGVIGPMYAENRGLVIVLRADAEVSYQYVDAVQKELQEARAVRVTFYTDLEQRITRERR
ncbi:MAG TPA: biopolymer transporter ExbD [Longimicrobiales bacterium]|nr:biopolymer transporter ExbD [Longimicrobiales bacterium]